MKNLFFVINKEKIYAYVVSMMTIVIIFFMSSIINSNLNDTAFTSANSIENINNQENGSIGEAISTSIPYNANIVEDSIINSINSVQTESEVTINTSTETKGNEVMDNEIKLENTKE